MSASLAKRSISASSSAVKSSLSNAFTQSSTCSGRLAPTISPQEVLAFNPAQRTIFFRSHPAYVNGFLTAFLGLEHAAGVIQFAPGAIPVPTIQTNFLSHNAIANLYEIQGQQIPVIDSFPGGTPVSPAPYTITGKPPVLGDSTAAPMGSEWLAGRGVASLSGGIGADFSAESESPRPRPEGRGIPARSQSRANPNRSRLESCSRAPGKSSEIGRGERI